MSLICINLGLRKACSTEMSSFRGRSMSCRPARTQHHTPAGSCNLLQHMPLQIPAHQQAAGNDQGAARLLKVEKPTFVDCAHADQIVREAPCRSHLPMGCCSFEQSQLSLPARRLLPAQTEGGFHRMEPSATDASDAEDPQNW